MNSVHNILACQPPEACSKAYEDREETIFFLGSQTPVLVRCQALLGRTKGERRFPGHPALDYVSLKPRVRTLEHNIVSEYLSSFMMPPCRRAALASTFLNAFLLIAITPSSAASCHRMKAAAHKLGIDIKSEFKDVADDTLQFGQVRGSCQFSSCDASEDVLSQRAHASRHSAIAYSCSCIHDCSACPLSCL